MARIQLVESLPRPIAYVLGGGASYGSVQVGHLRALGETDITPDFVVGTSVGSLNGAIVAEHPATAYEHLSTLWAGLSRQAVFGNVLGTALNLAKGKASAVPNTGLRAVIERALTSRTFEELSIPHTAVTTDFDTGEPVPINRGDLVSALLASSAIPLVFPPVHRENRKLVDGGIVANVPISIAAEQGAATIVVLDCGFTVMAPQQEETATGRLLRTAAIMAAQQVRRDLRTVDDRVVLYLPGPWPMRGRPDEFRRSAQNASTTFGLTMTWLHGLRVVGPGRYGSAPSDWLIKPKLAD
ncbi:MAG: patatin-like phospholipase family protein [Candidatus Nanopelagicales bacterium]